MIGDDQYILDFKCIQKKPVDVFKEMIEVASKTNALTSRKGLYWLMSEELYISYERILASRQIIATEHKPDQKPTPFGIEIHSSIVVISDCIELRSFDIENTTSIVARNVCFKES